MKSSKNILFVLLVGLLFFSCEKKENVPNEKPAQSVAVNDSILTEKEISYDSNGKNFKSFVFFKGDSTVSKPVVLVVPEWWGVNDYAKTRAKQLAEEGYFAMAVDFYGDGKVVDNPEDAQKLATPFYENPALAKQAYDAAKSELSNFSNADTSKMAIIGYCFGGAQALNMARQDASLKGAVSFHGNLLTGVKPNNNSVKLLVLNGEADSFVSAEEIAGFKAEMDSAKVDYKFINYPGAVHAFTNPDATEIGKKFNLQIAYDKDADEKSWKELQDFLTVIFM
ncbi:dienelactone hydrolase family protein [Moheibacter lacus]|uniref:Dienelactone hydrolase family protein n=1 Tax=Moheibacter lacus TaxID=2745851 RepID=A0A838ZU36_9FLAO|nr:dienelactone hydrolase family protein [Moheibacter lacus]MBA5630504.1 dienelactone hydrolase family protein [Moheibacter lacus]